ncbi:MAG: RcpC/CpaB family pilus assembly protein [Dehalococcoidia bacterium]
MTTTVLSPTRALRRPRRLDLRAVFGLFLMLLAIGGSVAIWSRSTETRAVLVATRDLPGGATLAVGDLAVAHVQVDDRIYGAAVPADELTALVGRQVSEPVHTQQLLTRAQISDRSPLAPNELLLTVPASVETAAGGRVRPGDAALVLLTTNKGTPEARTTVVLPRVTVQDVGYDDQGTVINTGGADSARGSRSQRPISWLTLIVTEEQALQLARAKWAGELDVALLATP